MRAAFTQKGARGCASAEDRDSSPNCRVAKAGSGRETKGQGTEQQDLRTDPFLGKSKNPKVRTPNCIEAVGVRRPLERYRSRGLHYIQDKGQRKARTP